jgi:hypothetical protein
MAPHGNDARENITRIGILFDVAVQHMGKAAQEAGFLGNEPQEFFDVDARQLAGESLRRALRSAAGLLR